MPLEILVSETMQSCQIQVKEEKGKKRGEEMSYFTLGSGEKLYYEDKGHGPDTLIMMHGWTSTHDVYAKPVESLQDQARCIIYDHRGHGESKNANSKNPTMETLASDLNEIIQGLSL